MNNEDRVKCVLLLLIINFLELTYRLQRWVIDSIRQALVEIQQESSNREVHLGQRRMVPQQCTDDSNVPYFANMMWQEQREPLEACHIRLQAFRQHNNNVCPPAAAASNESQEPVSSADVATQTSDDFGTVVDAPATVPASCGVTAQTGSGTAHIRQPSGDAEVPEEHHEASTMNRVDDSGLGESGGPDAVDGGILQDQTVNPGEYTTVASGHDPGDEGRRSVSEAKENKEPG